MGPAPSRENKYILDETKRIDEGTFGKVYKVIRKVDN